MRKRNINVKFKNNDPNSKYSQCYRCLVHGYSKSMMRTYDVDFYRLCKECESNVSSRGWDI